MGNQTKICRICNQEKDILCFYFRKETNKYRTECIQCYRDRNNLFYANNKEHAQETQRKYKESHYDEIQEYQKRYSIDNRDKRRKYKEDNKEELSKKQVLYYKNRYKNDPIYRLRQTVSKSIYHAFRRLGKIKDGSITSFLPYSMEELKEHLEKQFEPWMNWDNRKIYNPKTWNDDDKSTWTWNIDHIIPRSDLPFSSTKDDNCKKAWALENLRPLSAKQNILDGVKRTRHGNTRKKKTKKN